MRGEKDGTDWIPTAIAIGAVSLVAALAGAAIAGPTGSSASVTPAQVRKIAKSVADAEIARLASGLSVRSAQSASNAIAANSPALYAQVSGAGTVTASSRGIGQANVFRSAAGIYCFSGLPVAPKGGVAVLDALPPGASGPDGVQVGIGTFGRCPAATQAVVATFREGGVLVDDPFFVMFWF